MSTGWFWFAFTKQSLLILLSLASLESVCAHKLLAKKNMALALEELGISIPVDRPRHCIWMHLVSIWVRRPTIWSLKVLRLAPSARCCCCNYPFFCLDLFLPGGHDPSVCFLRGLRQRLPGCVFFLFLYLRFSHQTKAQHRLDPGYFAPGRSRGGGQWPVGSHHGPGKEIIWALPPTIWSRYFHVR